jgi:hypothetical protein
LNGKLSIFSELIEDLEASGGYITEALSRNFLRENEKIGEKSSKDNRSSG